MYIYNDLKVIKTEVSNEIFNGEKIVFLPDGWEFFSQGVGDTLEMTIYIKYNYPSISADEYKTKWTFKYSGNNLLEVKYCGRMPEIPIKTDYIFNKKTCNYKIIAMPRNVHFSYFNYKGIKLVNTQEEYEDFKNQYQNYLETDVAEYWGGRENINFPAIDFSQQSLICTYNSTYNNIFCNKFYIEQKNRQFILTSNLLLNVQDAMDSWLVIMIVDKINDGTEQIFNYHEADIWKYIDYLFQ